MTILLTAILHLPLSASNATAADVTLNPTQFVLKGKPAPFDGYLVEPQRFEKTIIALGDLQSTKENSELKSKLVEIYDRDRKQAEDKLIAQKKEFEFTEKGLKDKIADLDVWYRKPYIIAIGVAAVFILTGTLLP